MGPYRHRSEDAQRPKRRKSLNASLLSPKKKTIWGILSCGTLLSSVAIYLFVQLKPTRPQPPMANQNQLVMQLLGHLHSTVVEARSSDPPVLQRGQNCPHPSHANASKAQRKRHRSRILDWKRMLRQCKNQPGGRRNSRMYIHRNPKLRLHSRRPQVRSGERTGFHRSPVLMAVARASQKSPQTPRNKGSGLASRRALLQRER